MRFNIIKKEFTVCHLCHQNSTALHVVKLKCHCLFTYLVKKYPGMPHFPDTDRLFYADGFKLAQDITCKKSLPDRFDQAVIAMYQSVDRLIGSLLKMAEKRGVKTNCKKGCEWCCHQAVFANTYEIGYLQHYIRENLTKKQQAQIQERAETKLSQTSTLSKQEILNAKMPCPLLEDGICLAYDARPMACRIYLSTRVDTCQEFFHRPENDDNYPALMEFPLYAGRMLNEGFCAGLREQGVTVQEYRLEEGLAKI